MATIKASTALLLLLVLLPCHVTGSDAAVKRAAADELANLTAVVRDLSSRVDHLSDQLDNLRSNASHQADKISSLNDQVHEKDLQIRNLTQTLSHGDSALHDLDADCRSSVADIQNQISRLHTPVAFTARFRNDTVGELTAPAEGPGHTPYKYLRFDLVQFQTGGDNYNTSTGIFTAPSDGTYAFFLTLQRSDPSFDECLEATVMRGSHDKEVTVTACPPGYTSASNMAVTSLRAGDQLHVRILSPLTAKLFGYVHSTFSGFKLN